MNTFQCEHCESVVAEESTTTETHPGARGHTVTLVFCEDCR